MSENAYGKYSNYDGDKLKAQNELLLEAVTYYGSVESWSNKSGGRKHLIMLDDVEHLYFTRCESSYVGGKLARKTLEQIKLMEGE